MAIAIELNEVLSDDDFVTRAMAIVERDEIASLPSIWVVAERHRSVWSGEAGQVLIVGILGMVIDRFEGSEHDDVLRAMPACPPWLAQMAHALLSQAFGEADPAELGDAVVLTMALLLGASGAGDAARALLDGVAAERASDFFATPARAIVDRYASAATERFTCKLVIWDLDDTLWTGTLADGDTPLLDETRARFVRALNRHGVISAICSKNDFAAARTVLEGMDLWDEFVFPRIAFVPKGAVIAQMIADMRLRPVNVLFIDDNPHNLHEVAAAVPGIRTIDATSAECDVLLADILADVAHVQKSRVAEYRQIEAKLDERAASPLSDEAFLLESGIQAAFIERMEALELSERMEELVNRSNQLNYTGTRVEPGEIHRRILDIDHYVVLGVFVWDRYGYYGLVGVAVYAFRTQTLEHFALSCRVMHMGVEDAMLKRLAAQHFRIDPAQLVKPLPAQSSRAITIRSFADPEIRERVLAREAPRDWSRVQLRIMADCQSAPFHHYSRYRDEADFDNMPRYFCLEKVPNGELETQHFPPALVYAAAVDYTDFRWYDLGGRVDVAQFATYLDRFIDMVVAGGHRLLVMLPPEDRPLDDYALFYRCDPVRHKAHHAPMNALWRAAAARAPGQITLIELVDVLEDSDYVHAHHYVPSALRRIAGLIDDWYGGAQDVRRAA